MSPLDCACLQSSAVLEALSIAYCCALYITGPIHEVGTVQMPESPLLAFANTLIPHRLARVPTITTNESSSVNETAEGKLLNLVRRMIAQGSLPLSMFHR
jgi:hypothetical protein